MPDATVTRLHERIDDLTTRQGQLEGQVISLQNLQNKQDDRIKQVEHSTQQLLLSVTQVTTQLTSLERQSINLEKTVIEENRENRKIITKLLAHDQERDKELLNHEKERGKQVQEREIQLANTTESDKNRKQERFLKIWGIIGPILAAIASGYFQQ